uniref:Uncharacterized protein n=1 Tax=Oryza rufipogon TaxID=4529 RepID=A0A0E0R0V8_ORYRU
MEATLAFLPVLKASCQVKAREWTRGSGRGRGVVPGEGEGVDVGAVGGDGEAGLHEGQGARVGEERVPPPLEGGRVRERRLLDVGAQVAHRGEVVVGRGRLPLRVGGGDVEAERAVEVGGGGPLLVDRQHHVRRRRHGGRRRKRSGAAAAVECFAAKERKKKKKEERKIGGSWKPSR